MVKRRFQGDSLSKIYHMADETALIILLACFEKCSVFYFTAVVDKDDIFKTGFRQFPHECNHPFIRVQRRDDDGDVCFICPHKILIYFLYCFSNIFRNMIAKQFLLFTYISIIVLGEKGKFFFELCGLCCMIIGQ